MKIDFSLKSKQMLVGVVLSIIAFTLCCVAGGSLMKSAVLSCGFLVISIVKVHISQKARPLVLLGVFAVSGVAALWLTQFVQGEGIDLLDGNTLISGILFCGLLNCILFLVWPNIRFSTVVSVGAAMLLSTANYFVFLFRGSELAPADLLAVGTALNVAGGYSFSVIPNIIYGWVIFCLLVAALWILDIPKIGRKNQEYIFGQG